MGTWTIPQVLQSMRNADLTRWTLHWSGTLQLEVSSDTCFSIYPPQAKLVPRDDPWSSTSWVIVGSLIDRRYERTNSCGYEGRAYTTSDYSFLYKMTWGLSVEESTAVYSGGSYWVPYGGIYAPDGAPGTVVVTRRSTISPNVNHLYLKGWDEWEPKSRPATMEEVVDFMKLAELARDSVP